MVTSHAAALRELRMVMEARIRMAVAHQAKEIEELEHRLVRVRIEGAQAQSACDLTNAALEARTTELRTVERTHEQALMHAEARALLLTHERAEAESRAQLAIEEGKLRAVAVQAAERENAAALVTQAEDRAAALVAKAEERAAAAEAAKQHAEGEVELQVEAHARAVATAAQQLQAADTARLALEQRLVECAAQHATQLEQLSQAAREERELLERSLEEARRGAQTAEDEADQIAEQLEEERQRREDECERRAILQTMHEKETTALRQALHKATGFRDTRQTSRDRDELLRAAAKYEAEAASIERVALSPRRVRAISEEPGARDGPHLSPGKSPSRSPGRLSRMFSSTKSPTSPRLKSPSASSTGAARLAKQRKLAGVTAASVAGNGKVQKAGTGSRWTRH